MQVLIIDSVEALAEQIAEKLSMNAPHVVAEIATCLHPIEVSSDAGELAREVLSLDVTLDDVHSDYETLKTAAALITAHSRTVPTSFIRSIAKTYYDYNVPKNCGDADYEEWNDEECKIIAQQFGYHAE